MKKIIHYSLFVIHFFLYACSRPAGSGIRADMLLAEMRAPAGFAAPAAENLLDPKIAARYGIKPEDLADGGVLYDAARTSGGKIIVAVASNEESAARIEKALSSERTRLVGALEGGGRDGAVRKIKVKTRGRYCILIFCDNIKNIETIFDEFA